MSDEREQEFIPAEREEEKKELRYEDLPPLNPQQEIMLSTILGGSNYTDAYKAAGYSSIDYPDRAAHVLVHRSPLKDHLEYFRAKAARSMTKEWVADQLMNIVNLATKKERYDSAIRALEEVNKMGGNYAAQKIDINNTQRSIEDIRNARLEYKKDV